MEGSLPLGEPGCWHVGDFDQRRTISVIFENDEGDEDLALDVFASWVGTSPIPLAHIPVILWPWWHLIFTSLTRLIFVTEYLRRHIDDLGTDVYGITVSGDGELVLSLITLMTTKQFVPTIRSGPSTGGIPGIWILR
jgi:hypothetical protein